MRRGAALGVSVGLLREGCLCAAEACAAPGRQGVAEMVMASAVPVRCLPLGACVLCYVLARPILSLTELQGSIPSSLAATLRDGVAVHWSSLCSGGGDGRICQCSSVRALEGFALASARALLRLAAVVPHLPPHPSVILLR